MSTLKVDTIDTTSGSGNITVSRPITGLSGSGASLTNLSAANLTGTLPAISGASLTNLSAGNLTGTLTDIILKDYGETTNAIGSTGGGTQDIDLTLGNVVTATVDTSTNTFTFSNPTATGNNCGFVLYLTNGGSRTVNWPSTVDYPGAAAPALTAAGVDILVFNTTDAGTTWFGNLVGAAYA